MGWRQSFFASGFVFLASTTIAAATCTPIITITDLQNITLNPAGTYCLNNDIDASGTASWNGGVGFLPIGNFTGSLDGQGHTIDKLTIHSTSSNVGLFGSVGSGAKIQAIGLTNVNISTTGGDVGSLAGNNAGSITQSFATGSVVGNVNTNTGGLVGLSTGAILGSHTQVTVSTSGNATSTTNVGGLVGYNLGQIAQSYATGPVSGSGVCRCFVPTSGGLGAFNIGGLVGLNHSSSIFQSYATASVLGPDNRSFAGGLVGSNFQGGTISQSFALGSVSSGTGSKSGGFTGHSDGTISDSYARGLVTAGANGFVGGFVGSFDGSTFLGSITHAYSTGKVSGDSTNAIGGFIGIVGQTTQRLNGEYWNVETSGQTIGVGTGCCSLSTALLFGLTNTQAQTQSSYTTDPLIGTHWDFSNIWSINPSFNDGYPYLRWQPLGFMAPPLACGDRSCKFRYNQGMYTAGIVNSVLDHSLKKNPESPFWQYLTLHTPSPYNPGGDGVVVGFTGDKAGISGIGPTQPDDDRCIKGALTTPPLNHLLNPNSSACKLGFVSYDEHPGYDYLATCTLQHDGGDRASRCKVGTGTPVMAVADGTVVNEGRERCYKTYTHNHPKSCDDWGYLGIDHGNGYISQYGHLDVKSIQVAPGQKVRKGQQIALSGNTAPEEAGDLPPHLHFEVLKKVNGICNVQVESGCFFVDPYGWQSQQADPLYCPDPIDSTSCLKDRPPSVRLWE